LAYSTSHQNSSVNSADKAENVRANKRIAIVVQSSH
jgi:hypothetical protein